MCMLGIYLYLKLSQHYYGTDYSKYLTNESESRGLGTSVYLYYSHPKV